MHLSPFRTPTTLPSVLLLINYIIIKGICKCREELKQTNKKVCLNKRQGLLPVRSVRPWHGLSLATAKVSQLGNLRPGQTKSLWQRSAGAAGDGNAPSCPPHLHSAQKNPFQRGKSSTELRSESLGRRMMPLIPDGRKSGGGSAGGRAGTQVRGERGDSPRRPRRAPFAQ